MKKGILILAVIMLFMTTLSFGQRKITSIGDITSVTSQSDTNYTGVTYDDYYQGSRFYDGIIGYQFNVSDTVVKITFEGSNDGGTNYVIVSTIDTALSNINYWLFDTPLDFEKYRLGIFQGVGDTATVDDIIYLDKGLEK